MRSVMHLDADAFFASVEQAADPRLRGRPVAVGGEQRGIVASASYEARRFGVVTPMPTSRARKLCPKLILLPGDYDKYEQFSRWMFSYAYDFTPEVEVTSIDEGYLDLTTTRKNPTSIARTLRDAIRQSLKITVSEGLGSNKLVSQIASKLNKPAAFSEVPPGREVTFLHPLPNRWLPGVGPATSQRLSTAGLARIGQIAATPPELLELLVGAVAPILRQFAQGRDDRPIIPERPAAKSYSQQETFGQDQTDEVFLEATLRKMADQLMAKVRSDAKSVRTLTVKVRYNDMDENQSSESLLEPTDLETDLYGRLGLLLRKAWQRRVSLRLVSLKLSNVYEGVFRMELPLDRSLQQNDAQRRLARAVDDLRRTHGSKVVFRGHDWILRDTPSPAPASSSLSASASSHEATLPLRTVAKTHYRTPPRIPARSQRTTCVVPLAVRSYYSFLHSTLSPEAIVEWAKREERPVVGICDFHNLHGAVALAQSARESGVRPMFGSQITVNGHSLQLYVENAKGYACLCRLLSQSSPLSSDFLETHGTEGLIAISSAPALARFFPNRFYLGLSSPDALRSLAADASFNPSLPLVVSAPVHYATPADRWKFNIVQSIRTLTLLNQPHPEKDFASALHFRSDREWAELFHDLPAALTHTQEIAERCSGFSFPFASPQFPAFLPPTGETPRAFLRRQVFEGAQRRYPGERLKRVRAQIESELEIIHQVGYEEYFLVVTDLLQQCRRHGIEWITRGSAADSLVCYCLEISNVCPVRFDLYFRRFLNPDRMALHKLPDIDVDFPHDRKDDVVDLLFAQYGPEHCAIVGGFSTFHARSAVGDIGKVLGISEYQIRRMTEHFPWSFGGGWRPDEDSGHRAPALIDRLKSMPEGRDVAWDEEPYRSAILMAEFLEDFPRYPKMHPCGVVLSRNPIHELTPTFISGKGYSTTHYDMDGVEAIGLVKMDILAQGGLAVMRDVKSMLQNEGVALDIEQFTATHISSLTSSESPSVQTRPLPPPPHGPPWSDPGVWDLIASGGARAVHHIESPAMTSLCRMCQVRDIDGLIAIVSVIRPGAANEQKKVRFTRRYQGLEAPVYPHPSLEPCLRSTFGLVVYEEHILQICEAFAGLNGGRADVLRRALVKQKYKVIHEIAKEFAACARSRGHSDTLIQEVWELVTGFNGYAFCKAHSTAYGVEAYQSAWLKLHFPAEFMAGVLTNGKGFYSPLVYVLECHRLGIPMLPPWINRPGPAFQVETLSEISDSHSVAAPPSYRKAIRVPVSRIKHLTEKTLEQIFQEHRRGDFVSVKDFYLRVRPSREELEALLQVGAFDGFCKSRTTLFWELTQVHHAFGNSREPHQGWLLPPPGLERLPEVPLTEPTRLQRLLWETELLGFAASGHPLELYPDIAWSTYCPVHRLEQFIGQEIVTCGLIVEQRVHHQITGEPMKFLTLCDWTGMVETELFASTYRSYGLATVRYPVLEVHARVEPFENGRGHTLRVLRAKKPRSYSSTPSQAKSPSSSGVSRETPRLTSGASD